MKALIVLALLAGCSTITWKDAHGNPPPANVVLECEQEALKAVAGKDALIAGWDQGKIEVNCLRLKGYAAH